MKDYHFYIWLFGLFIMPFFFSLTGAREEEEKEVQSNNQGGPCGWLWPHWRRSRRRGIWLRWWWLYIALHDYRYKFSVYRQFSVLSHIYIYIITILPCAATVWSQGRATWLRQLQQHGQPGYICCRFKGTGSHWNSSADPAVCCLHDSQTSCLQDHLCRNHIEWNPL